MSASRILLISQVFYPDQVAVANLLTNLCRKLAAKGLDIEVWSAQPSYTSTERQPHSRVLDEIKIYYLRSTSFHKDNMTGRFINYFTYFVSVIFRLLFSQDKTPVVSHTSPPFLAIIIAFICSWKKRKFYYIIMDAMPDSLIRTGRLSSGSILTGIWQKMHYSALKRCHRIVVIGRDMKKWLTGIYPDGEQKILYLPIWQDAGLIKPMKFESNPFVIKNKLLDYFVVQYSGNMGLLHDMKTFGEAVCKSSEGLFYLFIGSGLRRQELIDSLNNNDRSNYLLFPFLENEEYAYSVTACHVALISLRDGLEGMAVPSKIMGIMAAGIPAIALVPEESEVALIIKEENCGIVVRPGDVNGIIQALNTLKEDGMLREKMGSNGRQAFLNKYTTDIVAREYFSLFSE